MVNTSSGGNSSVITVLFSGPFDNFYTNEGAVYCGGTDIPGILLLTRKAFLGDAYNETRHQRLAESYSYITENYKELITQEIRERLYLRYNSILQSNGILNFYKHPDQLSSTGATHTRLVGRLEKIDLGIAKGIKLPDLLKSCVKAFNKETCIKKIAKLCTIPLLLGLQIFAVSIIVADIVLMTKTPQGDLFSEDSEKQINQAFITTQVGSLFPSVIALLMINMIFRSMFVDAPYKKMRQERVLASFEGHFDDLLPDDPEAHEELLRIKELKYENA